MDKGIVTISIDVELAWGNWDNISRDKLSLVEARERPIVARLVEIFERHGVSATWAIVAAMLDRDSAVGKPGEERCWYGPDMVEAIASSTVRHDIGSHGGRHIYLDSVSEAAAEADIAFARAIHARHGLDFKSFVFPRNKIGHKKILERHGIAVFRGEDWAWHERLRGRQRHLGRAANLVDKMLPIAPEIVAPGREGAMVNLPGSMLFMSRNGLRGVAPASVMRAKLDKGVDAAMRESGVFHLWFHPSNFYYRTERQFELFDAFIGRIADLSRRGKVDVRTMASFAAT